MDNRIEGGDEMIKSRDSKPENRAGKNHNRAS